MEPCIAYVSESSARSLIGRPSETVFRRVEIAKVVASFIAAAPDWKDHGHNQMLAALTAVGERQSWLNLRKTACRRWVLTKCQKTVRRDTIVHKQAVTCGTEEAAGITMPEASRYMTALDDCRLHLRCRRQSSNAAVLDLLQAVFCCGFAFYSPLT